MLNSNDNIVDEYINATLENGFAFMIKICAQAATRIATRNINNQTVQTRSILDHVITDIRTFDFELSLSDVPISDHKQITLSFDDKSSSKTNFIHEQKTEILTVIDERKFDVNLASERLDNMNSFEELIELLVSIKARSQKKIKKISVVNPHKPWFNSELLELIRERNR